MKRSFLYILPLITLMLLSQGCEDIKNTLFKRGLSEGMVEYDAVPVDPSNPMASLAPNKMVMKFRDNKAIYEMSAGMGLFNVSFIALPEDKKVVQLLKVINKKYSTVMDEAIINAETKKMPKISIAETNETKEIAGYKCKRAIVSYDNKDHEPYDIYYTDDISIENVNWGGPFSSIKGVLLEYQLERYGIEMRFTAKTVSQSKIDKSTFKHNTDEYKLISKSEMDEYFQTMQ